MTPVGLEQDGVHLLEIDGFCLVADGFDEGANAEVLYGAQGAFGAAGNEVDGFLIEGGVGKADAVELAADIFGEVSGGELFDFCGVGDAGFDVMIDPELKCGVESGLCDEDEVVVFWEVFKKETEFAKDFDGEEVGVVYDGDDVFAFDIECASFSNDAGLAFVIVAVGFEFEGLAEEAQDVVPAVERAVDDRSDPVFGIVGDDVAFEDGLSGAGFSQDEAESALLGVDFEDVEVALLMGEKGRIVSDDEGVLGKAEVLSDHVGR